MLINWHNNWLKKLSLMMKPFEKQGTTLGNATYNRRINSDNIIYIMQ